MEKQYRVVYPDTKEVVFQQAEHHREVYAETLKHGGRGIISVATDDGWKELLGFEHPEASK